MVHYRFVYQYEKNVWQLNIIWKWRIYGKGYRYDGLLL